MAVLAPLAGQMLIIVEEEMEVVQVRHLVGPHAFPGRLVWDIGVQTAPEEVEEGLEERVARPSPWRTSSPSVQRMLPLALCI